MTSTTSRPTVAQTARLATKDASVVILTFLVMFMGVGHISAEAGLDALQTAVMTSLTVAAPAQAAAMQILGAGTGATAWITALTAVIIVNLRFMVMVAAVLSRLGRLGFWKGLTSTGLLSASSFAVILPRLMTDPPRRPVLYCGLVGAACSGSAIIGAVLGHRLAASVPPLASATLGAMIPIYFATLIAKQGGRRVLMANALAGAVLVPLASPILGSFSLVALPLIIAGATMLSKKET